MEKRDFIIARLLSFRQVKYKENRLDYQNSFSKCYLDVAANLHRRCEQLECWPTSKNMPTVPSVVQLPELQLFFWSSSNTPIKALLRF